MIYTIGHGTHSIQDFFVTLAENDINRVVDVRSYPASRRAPQFNRQKLERECEIRNIEYVWRGKSLGGFGEIPEDFFMRGIAELRTHEKSSKTVIMCSETDHTKCHRYQKITPVLEKSGIAVTHLVVIDGEPKKNITLSDF